MKLGPVTKIGNINKTKLKLFDDDIVPENFDAIVIFLIYRQFGAIWKLTS